MHLTNPDFAGLLAAVGDIWHSYFGYPPLRNDRPPRKGGGKKRGSRRAYLRGLRAKGKGKR